MSKTHHVGAHSPRPRKEEGSRSEEEKRAGFLRMEESKRIAPKQAMTSEDWLYVDQAQAEQEMWLASAPGGIAVEDVERARERVPGMKAWVEERAASLGVVVEWAEF